MLWEFTSDWQDKENAWSRAFTDLSWALTDKYNLGMKKCLGQEKHDKIRKNSPSHSSGEIKPNQREPEWMVWVVFQVKHLKENYERYFGKKQMIKDSGRQTTDLAKIAYAKGRYSPVKSKGPFCILIELIFRSKPNVRLTSSTPHLHNQVKNKKYNKAVDILLK